MDAKRLLTVMAERLYEDIKFVTEQNPTQIVDDDGARAYNMLLARVRRQFPTVDVVNDFNDWTPRAIKYKDALVVSGQLYSMLRALTDVAPVMRPAGPPPQRPAGPPPGGPPLRPQAQLTPLPVQRPPQQVPPSGASDTQNRLPQELVRAPAETPSRPLDPELYGSNLPPRRNEDGTIPFSLE